MKSQEKANRTSTSKWTDSGTRRVVLLWAMVAAVATVLIGSELQMVVAGEGRFECEKGGGNGDENVDKNGGIEIGGSPP